jgi:chaperonin GroES
MDQVINFEPLYDRILVRRVEEARQKGGVIIPDANKEVPLEGIVLACGLGKRNDAGEFTAAGKLLVKVGDQVFFGKYAGTEVKIDGEDLLIMREEEVLGITKRLLYSLTETKLVPISEALSARASSGAAVARGGPDVLVVNHPSLDNLDGEAIK